MAGSIIARCQLLLDVMQASRRYLGTAKLARIVDVPFDSTRYDLARLAGSGLIIRIKETGRQGRWRLADHVIVCMKCRGAYDDHHVERAKGRLEWVCDKPIPK